MASAESASSSSTKNVPTVCLIIGMAGSGKTTLLQRINAHVHQHKIPSYVVNLDPAVSKVPYGPNIDIRDSVKYKEVMKQYELGPNGGILTSLNLFATKFNQVIDLIDKRKDDLKYVFVDTPGQIEVFNWSASGSIITQLLSSSFPTCVVFVLDTPRNSNPITFMSNMMYAVSIMYKTRLPFILTFNKTDVCSHGFAEEWLSDHQVFEAALSNEKTYMATFMSSMGLAVEEFYKNIRTVGVSAMTGVGMPSFFEALSGAADEYREVFVPMLDKIQADRAEKQALQQEDHMRRVRADLEKARGREMFGANVSSPSRSAAAASSSASKSKSKSSKGESKEDDDEDEAIEYEELMKTLKTGKLPSRVDSAAPKSSHSLSKPVESSAPPKGPNDSQRSNSALSEAPSAEETDS